MMMMMIATVAAVVVKVAVAAAAVVMVVAVVVVAVATAAAAVVVMAAKMYDHCSPLSASNVFFFFLYKNPDFRVRMWTSDCQLSSCWARCFLNRTLSWQLKIKLYGLLTWEGKMDTS